MGARPAAADRALTSARDTTGLTEAEAPRRLAATGPDEVTARTPVRRHKRILAQLTAPLIMVLLGPSCSLGRPAWRTAFHPGDPTGTGSSSGLR
ncbi:cation-transporting P-type ATPase [Streptomyces sp. NPDC059593]|uniref:cation-transporting P-type ATPase n=1 Tax=Streptomyces sp. NPDC059593 TaxID=3346878 RepID=UPI00369A10D5